MLWMFSTKLNIELLANLENPPETWLFFTSDILYHCLICKYFKYAFYF